MARTLKFGAFELTPSTFELRRGGRAIKVERQAMELLLLLIGCRDTLVTRDQIAEKLWGKDVFVDAEDGINTAVRKIRRALSDNAARPKFVQRVPGKGYRFVAPVTEEHHRPGSGRVMLAVLPFANFGESPSDDYYSDGLTEETIACLGSIHPESLGVIARTSSMAYRNTSKSVSEIGKELGVDYILESSVRREANRVRISSQLIRVEDQTHIWAENYDRDSATVIETQAELGRAITDQVLRNLHGGYRHRPQTTNPDSFDLYLRGRHYFAQRNKPAITRSIEFYQQALALDPSYGLAHAGLADAYATLPITSDFPSEPCRNAAIAAAKRALETDGNTAEAHSAMAACSFWLTGDWDIAIQAACKAIEINPSYSLARFYLAHTYSNLGRHSEAEAEMKLAHEIDPFSVHLRAIHAQMLYQAGRFEAAAAAARRALALNANVWLGHLMLAKAQMELGEPRPALDHLQQAFENSDGNSEALALKTVVLATLGEKEQARQILALMNDSRKSRYVPPCNLALACSALGEYEQAYSFLQLAVEQNDVRLRYLPVDPKWRAMNQAARVRRLWPKPQRQLAARA